MNITLDLRMGIDSISIGSVDDNSNVELSIQTLLGDEVSFILKPEGLDDFVERLKSVNDFKGELE
ncbi:hypothetical protein ACGYLS_09630 [Bacillus subtilis]|uniref:hypothetical protein n=1 Tax=Bacillus cytotoxicus TaxID=580165 RepID=UPI00244924F1|nr:hypothetical protein [Bacillus cytotoxicus]MDH2889827.1 hypothetical protein [Bacillus cytotoxicus]